MKHSLVVVSKSLGCHELNPVALDAQKGSRLSGTVRGEYGQSRSETKKTGVVPARMGRYYAGRLVIPAYRKQCQLWAPWQSHSQLATGQSSWSSLLQG